ncbi:MAG: hypothetical protein MJE77_20285, partial [Proteobacteria bacterium]|nr:hypothetical protein [Pseudomonadota bacterium]
MRSQTRYHGRFPGGLRTEAIRRFGLARPDVECHDLLQFWYNEDSMKKILTIAIALLFALAL